MAKPFPKVGEIWVNHRRAETHPTDALAEVLSIHKFGDVHVRYRASGIRTKWSRHKILNTSDYRKATSLECAVLGK